MNSWHAGDEENKEQQHMKLVRRPSHVSASRLSGGPLGRYSSSVCTVMPVSAGNAQWFRVCRALDFAVPEQATFSRRFPFTAPYSSLVYQRRRRRSDAIPHSASSRLLLRCRFGDAFGAERDIYWKSKSKSALLQAF